MKQWLSKDDQQDQKSGPQEKMNNEESPLIDSFQVGSFQAKVPEVEFK